MVAPRGNREVDGLGVGVVLSEESTANAKGTSARDGLGDGDLTKVQPKRG